MSAKVAQALPWLAPIWQRLSSQAVERRLSHAILLLGQEGLGKRVLLREFSQQLLCLHVTDNAPCGACGSCHLFNAGSHPDLLMVEPEEAGKQIKIEQIRKITDFVNTTAQRANNKVVLLGPAEAMNINAANALLKSLEEPSSQTTLLLYSHQPSSLLATIKSRCQLYAVYTPPWQQALNWLQQNSEHESLQSILRLAKGAPLKAINLLEQEIHVQYMQFCQDMFDLQQSKANWSATLNKWKAWDSHWVMMWFYELILDVQKTQAGLPSESLAMQELQSQSAQVARGSQYAQLQSMHERLLDSQKAQQGQSNPNPVLIIETLLIDWLSLLGQSGRST
ncbi:MAG: DNA polymerase III subunit delta' [Bermanella sp.]